MTIRTLAAGLCCALLAACASPIDRQYSDLQTILEHQERSR